MSFISNARLYSVTPEIEATWQALLAHVADEAGVSLLYTPYPAPQPLEPLWSRPDLGCVFMCGYPVALHMFDVVPLAAPVPGAQWAQNQPVYRSDFIVRRDSPFQTLQDTFGHRFGWTVAHSHSGFNAPRRHLLQYRTPERPALFGESTGNLVTARAVLDAVVAGAIDVGPLDSYWHLLVARHRPELAAGIRVVESTALAPVPAFVASPGLGAAPIARLRAVFASASGRPWFAPLAEVLCIERFAVARTSCFARTLVWDQEAHAAGYAVIA